MDTLTYAEGHPNHGEMLRLSDHTFHPYALSYDTKSHSVQSFWEYPQDTPLLEVKSSLINSVELFVTNYEKDLSEILAYSQPRIARKKSGPILIDPQRYANYIYRATLKFDEFLSRITSWDGCTPISVILPYAHIERKEPDESTTEIGDDIIGEKSWPTMHGIMFVGKYH